MIVECTCLCREPERRAFQGRDRSSLRPLSFGLSRQDSYFYALTIIPVGCSYYGARLCSLSGNFNRVGCRSASGHLFNANPVEDRRAPFPALSGDTSRLPPHGAALQNFESVRARALMFWRIG